MGEKEQSGEAPALQAPSMLVYEARLTFLRHLADKKPKSFDDLVTENALQMIPDRSQSASEPDLSPLVEHIYQWIEARRLYVTKTADPWVFNSALQTLLKHALDMVPRSDKRFYLAAPKPRTLDERFPGKPFQQFAANWREDTVSDIYLTSLESGPQDDGMLFSGHDPLKHSDKFVTDEILAALAPRIKTMLEKRRELAIQSGQGSPARTRKTDEHLKWLVLRQVAPGDKYRNIAESSGKAESTVREGVRKAAALIGLQLTTNTRRAQ